MTDEQIAAYFKTTIDDHRIKTIKSVAKNPKELDNIIIKQGATDNFPIQQVYEYAKLDNLVPEIE